MLATCSQYASNMLVTCLPYAGNMQATCWQHAGNMLATCWQHTGNMLAACYQQGDNMLATRSVLALKNFETSPTSPLWKVFPWAAADSVRQLKIFFDKNCRKLCESSFNSNSLANYIKISSGHTSQIGQVLAAFRSFSSGQNLYLNDKKSLLLGFKHPIPQCHFHKTLEIFSFLKFQLLRHL